MWQWQRFFCDVVNVETPHNIAQASIVVSTVHATVETTSSSWCWLRIGNFWRITPRRLQDWIQSMSHAKLRYFCTGRARSEGIQNLEIYWGAALVCADQQKTLKVLVDNAIWSAPEHFSGSFCGPVFVYKDGKMDPKNNIVFGKVVEIITYAI